MKKIFKLIQSLDLEAYIYITLLGLKEEKEKKYSAEECDKKSIYLFKDANDFKNYFKENGIVEINEEILKQCIMYKTCKGTIIASKALCDYIIRTYFSQNKKEQKVPENENIESKYLKILEILIKKIRTQLNLLQQDKKQFNENSKKTQNKPFSSEIVKEALKRALKHSTNIKIDANEGNVISDIILSDLLKEIDRLETQYQSLLNQLLIISTLLAKQSLFINKFLKFIYDEYEQPEENINHETNEFLASKISEANDKELISNLGRLIARLEKLNKEKWKIKAKKIGRFIYSIKDFLDEEEKELLKYYNEDGTYTGYGNVEKLEQILNSAINKVLNLDAPEIESDISNYLKRRKTELIEIIKKTYPKPKEEIKPTTSEIKFHDEYPKCMDRKTARNKLQKYYDLDTDAFLKIPEDPEEMYTIINQCGFKEEITSALLEQFESFLEEQQYKLQYAYLSDDDFSIFITAIYIAKHKLDTEIEAIVNEIEEFNTLAQEENQEENQEEYKNFVRQTIEEKLKPIFEKLKEIVEKHKKSKTPIKLGNLIRKR